MFKKYLLLLSAFTLLNSFHTNCSFDEQAQKEAERRKEAIDINKRIREIWQEQEQEGEAAKKAKEEAAKKAQKEADKKAWWKICGCR